MLAVSLRGLRLHRPLATDRMDPGGPYILSCSEGVQANVGSLRALRLHRRLATDRMDSSTLSTATMLAESNCSSRKRP